MIIESIFYTLRCDNCNYYLENPEPQKRPEFWDDDEDMRSLAINDEGWAITSDFHICRICQEDDKKDS